MSMLKQFILILCFSVSSCLAEYKYDLSVCMIFRDEAPYLKEWIEFYRLLGVQHFYLCNHNSKDDYMEVLKPYIKQEIVELKEVPDANPDQGLPYFIYNHQNYFFNEIVQKARGISKWIAFLDSDEFLFPIEKDSLVEFLKDYEEFGGVVVNWQMFGTSDVSRVKPNQLVIETLTHCAEQNHPINTHVKSILQPERIMGFNSPHFAEYKEGYYQVNTDKISFSGPFSPYVAVDKLRINHYWARDNYYFQNFKIPRQIKFGNSLELVLDWNNQFNQTTDFSIQRFAQALKQRMELNE